MQVLKGAKPNGQRLTPCLCAGSCSARCLASPSIPHACFIRMLHEFFHRMSEPDLPDFCMSPNTAPEFPQIWDESSPDGNGSGFCFSDAELLSASPIAACVTKLLDRKEWLSDPKASTQLRPKQMAFLQKRHGCKKQS